MTQENNLSGEDKCFKIGKELDLILKKYFVNEKKDLQISLTYNDFLSEVAKAPQIHLRNIFQYFHDMVRTFVPEGKDEYPETPDSVGFLHYDMQNLLEKDVDEPFFADRLFANRFMKLIEGLQTGGYRNQIYLIEGPAGSGKSTFLNNLLKKLQDYSRRPEGTIYTTLWRIKLSVLENGEKHKSFRFQDEYVFACPHNDNPIFFIPQETRIEFLESLLGNGQKLVELLSQASYRWLLKAQPCPICRTIFDQLVMYLENPMDVFTMIYARPMVFDRSLGKGIVIWNPGDKSIENYFRNTRVEEALNRLFKSDEVSFKYSDYAFSNNGIYVLMDVKENNIHRFLNLHGIISDGVHKVENLEERILSLFVGIINPEDRIHFENIPSFQDRIVSLQVSYVLDYQTEVKIFENKFGTNIKKKFLPRVLENFARIIISTRLSTDMEIMRKWLKSVDYYTQFIDKNLLLLRLELYRGNIPRWLRHEDEKNFTRQVRLQILNQAEKEGKTGISGRQSLVLFSDLIQRYEDEPFITMDMIKEFFQSLPEKTRSLIPPSFIDDLIKIYEINILQEVRQAMFEPNELKIKNEIADYLFSLMLDQGEEFQSPYTGEQIIISDDWWNGIEIFLYGREASYSSMRNEVRKEFVSKTLAQEIKLQNKNLFETELFNKLYQNYMLNLQKNTLEPFSKNENYRRALFDFNRADFATYDEKIRYSIQHLIDKLYRLYYVENNVEYDITEDEGKKRALYIAQYVIERDLQNKYKNLTL
ncbi:MAG: hypothetical protein N2Z72_01320 [Bacteroidales bacterium]|nr:hypothetical protein [Bacteroidales bacterium]